MYLYVIYYVIITQSSNFNPPRNLLHLHEVLKCQCHHVTKHTLSYWIRILPHLSPSVQHNVLGRFFCYLHKFHLLSLSQLYTDEPFCLLYHRLCCKGPAWTVVRHAALNKTDGQLECPQLFDRGPIETHFVYVNAELVKVHHLWMDRISIFSWAFLPREAHCTL